MDQLISASLSRIHYWYEVDTLKLSVLLRNKEDNICTKP